MLSPASHRLRHVAHTLHRGGVIAYPTEAVYGLGCDPLNREAVYRLLDIKQREVAKGLILIASDVGQLAPFVDMLPPARMAEIAASWPGPNTWLMPARAGTPVWLTGRFATLAVRVTAHPLAAALCQVYGGAIVSTSANRAERPPARTAFRVRATFGDALDAILCGPCQGADRPSTIRDGASGRVLRA